LRFVFMPSARVDLELTFATPRQTQCWSYPRAEALLTDEHSDSAVLFGSLGKALVKSTFFVWGQCGAHRDTGRQKQAAHGKRGKRYLHGGWRLPSQQPGCRCLWPSRILGSSTPLCVASCPFQYASLIFHFPPKQMCKHDFLSLRVGSPVVHMPP
jgi:hypothetical protein